MSDLFFFNANNKRSNDLIANLLIFITTIAYCISIDEEKLRIKSFL